MKTYKNLYPRIWAYDNLYTAWRAAVRCKRKSPGVAGFESYDADGWGEVPKQYPQA